MASGAVAFRGKLIVILAKNVTSCQDGRAQRSSPGSSLSHPDKDLVAAEGQHRPGARALQVHDHAGAVLQPQIATARGAQTRRAGALRVSPAKIGDIVELIDRARGTNFFNPTTGARDSADQFERIRAPLEIEGAATEDMTSSSNSPFHS